MRADAVRGRRMHYMLHAVSSDRLGATRKQKGKQKGKPKRTGVSTATHDARHRPAPPSSSTHGRSGGLNRELQPQAARQKFKSIPKENHI